MNARYLPAAALAVVNSLVQLGGVLALGWPAGNVYLLLWVENLVVTLLAVTRMGGVKGAPDDGRGRKAAIAGQLLVGTLIHGIFAGVLAVWSGVQLTLVTFVAPLVLLLVRYAVETIGWYLRDARPATLAQAYGFALRRVVMLHVAILACWFIMVFGTVQGAMHGLPGWLPRLPVLALAALLVVKTIVEVRAIGRGPNAGTSWRLNTG